MVSDLVSVFLEMNTLFNLLQYVAKIDLPCFIDCPRFRINELGNEQFRHGRPVSALKSYEKVRLHNIQTLILLHFVLPMVVSFFVLL